MPTHLVTLDLLGTNHFCPLADYELFASSTTDYPVNATICDSCTSWTCQNGGTCHGSLGQLFYCSCPIGYTGPNCETLVSCVPGQGVQGPFGCACYSGFTGSNCDVNSAGSCVLSPVDPYTSEVVAEFMTSLSSVTPAGFEAVVRVPARLNRVVGSITYNGLGCNFLNSLLYNFTKGFVPSPGCADQYTASISMYNLKYECGFTEVVLSNETQFAGRIYFSVVDHVATFQNIPIYRTTQTSLALVLNFPDYLNVTTELLGFQGGDIVDTAITYQGYDPLLDVATITIVSSTQWPSSLSLPELTVGLGGLPGVLSLVNIDCNGSPENQTACLQETTLTISPIVLIGNCSFDGLYSIQWTHECLYNVTCFGPNVTNTSISLTSGNLCGVVTVDASLTPSLSFWATSFNYQSTSVFQREDTVFVGVSVVADVTISSYQIISISILISELSLVIPIFSSGVAESPYNETDQLSLSTEGFSFVATYGDWNSIFPNDTSSITSFQVEVELSVTYTTGSRRRDVLTETAFARQDAVLDTRNQVSRTPVSERSATPVTGRSVESLTSNSAVIQSPLRGLLLPFFMLLLLWFCQC